jgi:hypothetical protein
VLGGLCLHGGRDNVIENNIFVDGRDHQIRLQPRGDFAMEGNRFVRNIVVYSDPEADLLFSWRWPEDSCIFEECDRNLYWLRGADLSALEVRNMPLGTFSDWQAAGFDSHSRIEDPGFLDEEEDDYQLPEGSRAYSLGFERIPVEEIGVRGRQRAEGEE